MSTTKSRGEPATEGRPSFSKSERAKVIQLLTWAIEWNERNRKSRMAAAGRPRKYYEQQAIDYHAHIVSGLKHLRHIVEAAK